ncbi:MAG: UvrD-helicase domain-containing protein [Deltaproteobacteria bacterium]|nr:UvrD-helicase domain-containing protein [Deltaproteobacteria bacterium]
MESSIRYKDVLNPAQLEAVMTLGGPLLVIAGAGSGKTRTLIYRVARLVESGIPPENILLLTFTRKASGEMLERAANLADERCRNVAGGTFHSLAHRVLRSNAHLLGFDSSFTILDRQDMEEIVRELVNEAHIGENAARFPKKATIASIISKAANLEKPVEWLMTDEYSQFLEHAGVITAIEGEYSRYKKENQMMDYDDLLLLFRQLLSENETVRGLLARRYGYIMVDEYQDTNGIQADIVKWLGSSHQNVMVVGDDSQAIYSFRGANYKNMFEFQNIFPQAKIIRLEQNYRSTQPILRLTNAIMDRAVEKFTKCLFTQREGGDKPEVIDVKSDPEQAMYIASSIKSYRSKGYSYKDMAVLFRAAHHSFELELELAREGIPYVKYGGFKFLESSHIKDLLTHLRVITNKNDIISWGRILRLVKNIGQKKSQTIIDWLKNQPVESLDLEKWPGLGKKEQGLRALAGLLKALSEKDITPSKAVELVYAYYNPILRENYDNYPKREKDLEQLMVMAERYKGLSTFLDELVLDPPSSSADLDPDAQTEENDIVTLSTVHSAKGLEWPIVFIIWVMDGYFPSARAYCSEESIEEERRLMYVATTRAKDRLIMCYPGAESLPLWQVAETGIRAGLSTFIREVPDGIVTHRSKGALWPSFKSTWSGSSEKAFQRTDSFKLPSAGKGAGGLRPGDRVKHPAFGKGVISRFVDTNKVEVLFSGIGRKLLHLAHTTLTRI